MSVLVDNKNIYEISSLQLKELKVWAKNLPAHLNEEENKIADLVLKEISSRTSFLSDVSLEYLTLMRLV